APAISLPVPFPQGLPPPPPQHSSTQQFHKEQQRQAKSTRQHPPPVAGRLHSGTRVGGQLSEGPASPLIDLWVFVGRSGYLYSRKDPLLHPLL
ncbi:hypothetical protein IscW_ISCW004548, partial [Ixodes scapularis]